MWAVAVQNTEDDELSLMGPYDNRGYAELVRDGFVAEMDARYGILDVYSVWVVRLRDASTEINMFRSLFDLFGRTSPHARTLDNPDGLDEQ